MHARENLIQQIDDLFNPRSVAIVGAPRGMKSGAVFLIALLEQGFSGDIYPVNPRAETISGLKSYPSISDIPRAVDLAIVLVPHQHSLADKPASKAATQAETAIEEAEQALQRLGEELAEATAALQWERVRSLKKEYEHTQTALDALMVQWEAWAVA